jgi:hypothetical protein
MTRPSTAALLEALAAEGAWDPERRAAAAAALADYHHQEAPQPWYIRLLATAGAWGSALFFVAFLALLDVIDSEGATLFVGVMMLGSAVAIRRAVAEKPSTFFVQLALACSIGGQLMTLFGVAMLTESESATLLLGVAIHAGLLAVYPDRLHRFLSTSSACLMAAAFVHLQAEHLPLHLPSVAIFPCAVWLMEHEAALEKTALAPLRGPVAGGLLASIFAVLIFSLWDRGTQGSFVWLTTGGLTLGVMALGRSILRELDVARPEAAALVLGGTALMGLVSWNVPGTMAALGALVLGFHRRDALLSGAACAFLAGFLFYLYYDLDISLLAKSVTLMLSGGLLLGARFLIPKDDAASARELLEVF